MLASPCADLAHLELSQIRLEKHLEQSNCCLVVVAEVGLVRRITKSSVSRLQVAGKKLPLALQRLLIRSGGHEVTHDLQHRGEVVFRLGRSGSTRQSEFSQRVAQLDQNGFLARDPDGSATDRC